MKKIALISAATAASLAFAPAAFGAPTQKLEVKLTSSKAGTKAKPTNVGMTFNTGTTSTDPTGAKQTITYAKIILPKGIKLNYKAFPECAAPYTACQDTAPKSQIGSGNALASVTGVDYNPTGELTPFIGAGGKLVIRTFFTQPAFIDEPLLGNISTSGGGYSFDFNVPESLQVPLPNAPQQILDFKVNFAKKTVKKGSKTTGLIALESCPKGGYVFKGEFKFRNNETATASTTVKCTSAKK